MSDKIPFSQPPRAIKTSEYVQQVLLSHKLSGDGPFSRACEDRIIKNYGGSAAFLTPSCTSALEMALVASNLSPGDEVIVPSFTFTSTANAAALLGFKPVFVDIDPETWNLDPQRLSEAIGPRTKVVMPVHYAGVACDMDTILSIAHKLTVIEDAAQGIGARHKQKYLGTLGRYGAISFHETKNLGCGEGGVILIRDDVDVMTAQIARDKGTNRKRFLRGEVDKYTWIELGSSYLVPETSAAFLLSQLEEETEINARRLKVWNFYRNGILASPSLAAKIQLQKIPSYAHHNAHIFAMVFAKSEQRDTVRTKLAERGITASAHYEPLHRTPGGQKFGRAGGPLVHADSIPYRLLRLPIYADLSLAQAERVLTELESIVHAL